MKDFVLENKYKKEIKFEFGINLFNSFFIAFSSRILCEYKFSCLGKFKNFVILFLLTYYQFYLD